MKYYFLLSVIFVLSVRSVDAQSNPSCGARASGMGNAVVTVSDEWSAFHNIAGIACIKRYSVGLWYKNDYALKDYGETAMVFSGKLLKGGFALSFYRFGNEFYKVNCISAGYAHKISFVSLGLQTRYVQTAIEDMGVKSNIVLDFGGITELVPAKLFFGATISNVNQAKLNKELLPVVMNTGLSYRPGKKLMLNAQVEKDILYRPTFKGGLEYALVSAFKVRTGINTHPFTNFFGAGFNHRSFQLDYNLAKHTQLGYSHRISISVFFNK